MVIPFGRLRAPRDDEASRRLREEIKERLLRGEDICVGGEGGLTVPPKANASNQHVIYVPRGKLASFYWYENDPELYQGEMEAMRRFFPKFKLHKQADGRLAWVGQVKPGMLNGKKRTYTIQLVYSHDHPNNDSYGGSIKVYLIEPDLESLAGGASLPHTLRDAVGALYICTSRHRDFGADSSCTTSAASVVGWAVKWIGSLELWLDGKLTREQFADHKI